MGTRGFISFAADGQIKTAYNHWDSYPDGLGLDVLKWLREVTAAGAIADVRRAVVTLRVVQAHEKPTPADVERLEQWTDLDVSSRSTDDWYCLLRGTQGNPAAMLAAGVIEDASSFPANSLFAEWGYVIDFDNDGQLEAYEGFQHASHKLGRFAEMTGRDNGYYPVALKASWPLADLPGDEIFLAALNQGEEEES